MNQELLLDLTGTYRVAPPESTVANAVAVGKKIGITRLANVTGLDVIGLPTWLAVRPLSRSLTVSQGKGISHVLAQASALMESIELHHAEFHVSSDLNTSLWESLENAKDFVNPFAFPINRLSPIDLYQPIEWTTAKRIGSSERKYVPTDLAWLGRTAEKINNSPFVASSNGLASGNTLDEALIHALCEVVERDQVSFWATNRIDQKVRLQTKVKLHSVEDKNCISLISKIEQCGLDISIWNATGSIKIPTFVCSISDTRQVTPYPQRASGHGCHPVKGVALSRAITEAVQSRLTHIAGSRDDCGWKRYREKINVSLPDVAKWASDMSNEPEAYDYAHVLEAKTSKTATEMLAVIVSALHRAGLENIYYVDHTQAEYGIPVCHVFVEHIEHNALRDQYTPGQRMIRYLKEEGIAL